MHCLRVQQLVALLSALQALHALSMHFLSHLLITRLLLLRSSLVFNPLNMALFGIVRSLEHNPGQPSGIRYRAVTE